MTPILDEAKQSAETEYRERRKDYPNEAPSDVIHEIADSHVPTYTHELLKAAFEDYDLAMNEPERGPAFDGSPTPINIIAANFYERLCEHLYEVQSEMEDETDD